MSIDAVEDRRRGASAPSEAETNQAAWRPDVRRWRWFSPVLVVFGWALVRELQTHYLGLGTGFDVGLYQQYAQQWASGAAAYVDFQPEYPPGALPIFLLPLLL